MENIPVVLELFHQDHNHFLLLSVVLSVKTFPDRLEVADLSVKL